MDVSLLDKILGRPLTSSEAKKEELTVATGVPVLGLDALASTAYGPEAALTILVPLGTVGLRYMPMITLAILALLVTLYLSYRQTAAAYPEVVAHTLSRKRTSEFAPASLPARHCCLITYSTLPWEFRPASTRCFQRFRGCTDTGCRFACWCSLC